MVKIAVSFHCDTHNTFSTHSYRANAGINVKMVIKKVGKDLEQIWWGVLVSSKLIVQFCTAINLRKIYHQYCDTHDMEWPKAYVGNRYYDMQKNRKFENNIEHILPPSQ